MFDSIFNAIGSMTTESADFPVPDDLPIEEDDGPDSQPLGAEARPQNAEQDTAPIQREPEGELTDEGPTLDSEPEPAPEGGWNLDDAVAELGGGIAVDIPEEDAALADAAQAEAEPADGGGEEQEADDGAEQPVQERAAVESAPAPFDPLAPDEQAAVAEGEEQEVAEEPAEDSESGEEIIESTDEEAADRDERDPDPLRKDLDEPELG